MINLVSNEVMRKLFLSLCVSPKPIQKCQSLIVTTFQKESASIDSRV